MTDATALLREMIERLQGRQPRFRYFECKTCRRGFLWTVERLGDERYASAVLVPYGKGSRSGDPVGWKNRLEVHHATRKAAKARALRLYRAHIPDHRPEIGDRVEEIRGGRRGVVADPGSGAHPAAFLGVLWDGQPVVVAVDPSRVRKVPR